MAIFYTPSTSQYAAFPMKLFLADLHVEGRKQPLRMINNTDCEWGEATTVEEYSGEPTPLPVLLVIRWWSPCEQKFYNGVVKIDSKRVEKLWKEQDEKESIIDKFTHVVAGMAPYGGVAIWLRGYRKAVLVDWKEVESIQLPPQVFQKLTTTKTDNQDTQLPPKKQFDLWMRQRRYRYVPLEEYWDGEQWNEYDEEDPYYDDIDVLSVEDKRTDGTFDITGDMSLLRYHETGCPNRFCVRWQEGKTDYEVHFWLDIEIFASFFDRFFNITQTDKADLLVRMDTRANQYELALRCNDTQQITKPVPPESYQLLIFRNDTEFYKSENYAQENGAWNW